MSLELNLDNYLKGNNLLEEADAVSQTVVEEVKKKIKKDFGNRGKLTKAIIKNQSDYYRGLFIYLGGYEVVVCESQLPTPFLFDESDSISGGLEVFYEPNELFLDKQIEERLLKKIEWKSWIKSKKKDIEITFPENSNIKLEASLEVTTSLDEDTAAIELKVADETIGHVFISSLSIKEIKPFEPKFMAITSKRDSEGDVIFPVKTGE